MNAEGRAERARRAVRNIDDEGTQWVLGNEEKRLAIGHDDAPDIGREVSTQRSGAAENDFAAIFQPHGANLPDCRRIPMRDSWGRFVTLDYREPKTDGEDRKSVV